MRLLLDELQWWKRLPQSERWCGLGDYAVHWSSVACVHPTVHILAVLALTCGSNTTMLDRRCPIRLAMLAALIVATSSCQRSRAGAPVAPVESTTTFVVGSQPSGSDPSAGSTSTTSVGGTLDNATYDRLRLQSLELYAAIPPEPRRRCVGSNPTTCQCMHGCEGISV
jgi:hypothetical protein